MRVRLVTNTHGCGGGERSASWIADSLAKSGHSVIIHPANYNRVSPSFPADRKLVEFGVSMDKMRGVDPYDMLIFYANNATWTIASNKNSWASLFLACRGRKVCILNFDAKNTGLGWFRSQWDLFMFLNHSREDEFLRMGDPAPTKVLAPPVDLSPFLQLERSYKGLHFVRHGKWNKIGVNSVRVLSRWVDMHPDLEFSFMTANRDIKNLWGKRENFHIYEYDEMGVDEFLARGDCFWYSCATNVREQGPRVIVEAMAAGLPVISDNRFGMQDRVTPDTGWLCDDVEDYPRVMEEILADRDILKARGEAARRRAKTEFYPARWLHAIVGTETCDGSTTQAQSFKTDR